MVSVDLIVIELFIDFFVDFVFFVWLIGVWEGIGVIDYFVGDECF